MDPHSAANAAALVAALQQAQQKTAAAYLGAQAFAQQAPPQIAPQAPHQIVPPTMLNVALPTIGQLGSPLLTPQAMAAAGYPAILPGVGVPNAALQAATLQQLASAYAPQSQAPQVVPPPGTTPAGSAAAISEKKPEKTKEEEPKKELVVEEEPKIAEPVRCHLHKKHNNACRFCKAAKQQAKEAEEAKAAAKLKALGLGNSSGSSQKNDKDRDVLQITDKVNYNFGQKLKEQILRSQYYRVLHSIPTFEDLCDDIERHCDGVEVYAEQSVTTPSNFICSVYRLFSLEINAFDLRQILNSHASPHILAAGCLFVRYGLPSDQLWSYLHPFLLDIADLQVAPARGGDPAEKTTIGAFVESLLMEEKYDGSPLPRIPMRERKFLEEQLAPIPQYRKRAEANSRPHILNILREGGTPVEASINGEWVEGKVGGLIEDIPSRIQVRVKPEDGKEEICSVGKIVLQIGGDDSDSEDDADRRRKRKRSRSRSRGRRGRSPDWSRYKGKADKELVEELREKIKERSVCNGKVQVSVQHFDAGLRVRRELGRNSEQLLEEEAKRFGSRKQKKETEEEIEERQRQHRIEERKRKEIAQEKQKIFEKYGVTNRPGATTSSGSGSADVESPDVLRLG